MSSLLRIPIADLLRRAGASRHVSLSTPVADLRNDAAEVPLDALVDVDVMLERIPEGMVVRGTLGTTWVAQCSRCLEAVGGSVEVHVDELYEPEPVPGETYQLDPETLDLEPLVRDALVLELPPAPLCRPDCAGLCASCGANRNEAPCECVDDDTDPRWAALKSLEL